MPTGIKMISNFEGEFEFLGNFYECDIEMDGLVYPSVEHAFQASRTFNMLDRASIRDVKTPIMAKNLGEKIATRDDWDSVKLDLMFSLLEKKFELKELRRKLLSTKDLQIVSNYDIFWGKIDNVGENNLGNMLMKIRNDIFKLSVKRLSNLYRDCLIDCGWKRDYDGDVVYGECWSPPWEPNCQFNLFAAVEEQRQVSQEFLRL